MYDNYVEVLETGSVEALQHYARDLSERIIPRGVETHEVVGIVLLLRDVLARSLFEKYQSDFALLNRVLDAYEPAANRIANTVAVSFVEERERVIRQQQDAIRELSTPGAAGPRTAADPADHRSPRHRARADSSPSNCSAASARTGRRSWSSTSPACPDVDETVANHLVQTVDASRLMGASVIITGLSPEIAQTLVTIGVDLSKMNTDRRPAGRPRGGRAAARLQGETAAVTMADRDDGDGGAARWSRSSPQGPTSSRPSTLRWTTRSCCDSSATSIQRIGVHRSRGVIIDVAALDVLDSFGSRTLRDIAEMAGCAEPRRSSSGSSRMWR